MFAIFFLGGVIPSIVQVMIERAVRDAGFDAAAIASQREFRVRALTLAHDGNSSIGEYLADCPATLLFLFKGTLFFLPLLVLLVGFDQIVGEIQHRTMRYAAIRARRSSLVAGKALGVWAVIAVMVLVLHATVWLIMIGRGTSGAGETLGWGVKLWGMSVASAGAYVGLVSLVSSSFRTPVVALFSGFGVLFAMAVTNLILGLIEKTRILTWLFPSTYASLLVSPDPLRALGGIGALIAYGVAMACFAAWLVERRDL